MAGVKSNVDNLAAEDNAYREEVAVHGKAVHGDAYKGPTPEDEPMGDMIGGDQVQNHYYPKPDPSPTPSAPPVNQPAAEPEPRPGHQGESHEEPAWKTWVKRAVLASVLPGGIATGILGKSMWDAWQASPEKPPVIEQPAENPGAYLKYGVEIVPGPNRPEN